MVSRVRDCARAYNGEGRKDVFGKCLANVEVAFEPNRSLKGLEEFKYFGCNAYEKKYTLHTKWWISSIYQSDILRTSEKKRSN